MEGFWKCLKITSIVIVGGTSVTSIVLAFGGFTIPLVIGILAQLEQQRASYENH